MSKFLAPRISLLLWLLGFAVAAVLVFIAPWHFPPSLPVLGESYALGFSNRVATLGMYAGILISSVALLLAGRSSRIFKIRLFQTNRPLCPAFHEAKAEYTVFLVSSTLMSFYVLFWSSFLVMPYWGESTNFLSRLDFLAMGFRPYTDFQFNYGPLMLYVPLAIERISLGRFGLEASYALTLAMGYILGFAGMFVFIRTLNLPTRLRALVFALGCLTWVPITLGLNYVPLRFTILPASLVLLNRGFSKFRKSRHAPWLMGLFALVMTSACLFLSPEMGIAATAACMAYGGVVFLTARYSIGLAIAVSAALSGAAVICAFPGYLHSTLSFGSGANNLPVYPNLYNIPLLLVATTILPILCAPVLGFKTSGPKTALPFSIGITCLALMPAALGRCDPGHIYINEMMLFFLAFPTVYFFGKVAFWSLTGYFLIVFIAIGEISYWSGQLYTFQEGFKFHVQYQLDSHQHEDWKKAWAAAKAKSRLDRPINWSKVFPYPDNMPFITSMGLVNAPLGADIGLERALKLQPGFKPEYFVPPVFEAFTEKDIDRKVSDCDNYDLILIPKEQIRFADLEVNAANYEAITDPFLSKSMLCPVRTKMRNLPLIPQTMFIKKFLQKYEKVGEYGTYLAYKKKKESS